MAENSRKKILVIGPSWIGDMVMAQSLFMTLKQNDPFCQIDVLAPAWSFPLLDRMPEISHAIEMPLGHGKFGFITRIKLGQHLSNSKYQQAIILPNSWKSALIPFFARIPVRTGYIGEYRWGIVNDSEKLDKDHLTMTVQRFVSLGYRKSASFSKKCPIPKLAINKVKQDIVIKQYNLQTTEKILALCPGAEYGSAKRWPAQYFAEIAKKKIQQGWQVWLFGSDKDIHVARLINKNTGNLCNDFTGQTTLAEAIDLMSLTDTVVSNDSGLMHVASALDKKVIAIYGSSDPDFTPPLNANAKVISLGLDCSPCFKRECPLEHMNCLNKILPENVLAEIEP